MHQLIEGPAVADPVALYQVERAPRPGHSCWVAANMVAGLDGSAAIGGRVGALSGGADAVLFRALRSIADVVLVGAGTVRSERYGPVVLGERRRDARMAAGQAPVPRVAVISGSLEFDWTIPLFSQAGQDRRPLIFTTGSVHPERLLEAAEHAEVVVIGDDELDLPAVLDWMAGSGNQVVWCEGGPHLLGELVALDLLDELCLTLAPVMGGDPLPVALDAGSGSLRSFDVRTVAVADDGVLFLRYEVRR